MAARRTYKDPKHQQIYDHWCKAKPAQETFEVVSKSWDGSAYVKGYRWPDREQFVPGSLARIAWAAGVDNRHDDDAAQD